VECFHKASLIHDDIEDQDAERYGEKTLHEEYGVAVALNVGDLLIGEGYRLLASSKVSPAQITAMTKVASHGQRELCRGQGAELCWAQNPDTLSSRQVIEIFRKKTAPAFEVALQIGSIYADLEKYEESKDTIKTFSEALGIAYQIRDDISDLGADGDTNDIEAMRPSLLLAVAHEKAKGENKDVLAQIWQRQLPAGWDTAKIEALYAEVGAIDRANILLETYKEEGIRCLRDLQNQNLKGLLRRVLGKIFNDTEIKGWCNEFEKQNGVKDGIRLGEPTEIAEPAMA
jgi:geranylgeranyl diphosphate synthase type II